MNLTTLGNLKSWLKVKSSDDDNLLQRLITQVSGLIYSYLQRPSFVKTTYTDVRNGSGTRRVWLENWPVIAVSSVMIGNTTVPQAPNAPPLTQAGWYLTPWDGLPPGDMQTVDLCFYDFCKGLANVAINYTAGYVVQNEAQTITAATDQVVANQIYGSWAADNGVTYANGTALTAIASGTPSAGQYVPPILSNGNGAYQFASADHNAAILLSYSFIPAPIEQACIEWASERYRYRERIGETSRSVGSQETASYSIKGMPEQIREMLDPYRKLVQDFQV